MIRAALLAALCAGAACTGAAGAEAPLRRELSDYAAKGSFLMGVRDDRRPMSFIRGDTGSPDGLAVALCREIAAALQARLRAEFGTAAALEAGFRRVTLTRDAPDAPGAHPDAPPYAVPRERFAALREGAIDILCGATTRTLDRAEAGFDFTMPVFLTGGALVSPDTDDARIHTLADLGGQRVAVLKNTTTEAVLRRNAGEYGYEVGLVPDYGAAFDCLSMGRCPVTLADGTLARRAVAAFAGDQLTLLVEMRRHGVDTMLWVSRQLISFEPYALVFRAGERDLRLLTDRVLSDLYGSGRIAGLLEDHVARFGDRVPPALLTFYRSLAIPP